MPADITDYNSWTYSLPLNPSLKDYKQLSTKLKSFVGSSKFLRLGSTVDQYDLNTGKRVKRPIKNVVYSLTPGGKGIDALTLRDRINKALISNNPSELLNAAKYRYYSADTIPTKEDLKQLLKQLDKLKRNRMLLGAVIFGGAGSLLGLLPYIGKRRYGLKFTLKDFIDSLKMAGIGITGGLGLTGLLEATRG